MCYSTTDKSMTGLARKNIALLISLTNGWDIYTQKPDIVLFNPSNTRQLMQSESAGQLPLELIFTPALNV